MNEPEYLSECPQCGAAASGRYCNQCGASLNAADGTLRSEIKSNFTSPVITLLAVLKAAWLLLRQPTAFCRAWLNGPQSMAELGFPLSNVWQKMSSGQQAIARPYKSVAIGIALLAATAGLEAGAWKLAGLGDWRAYAEERQLEGMQQAANYYYGHSMRFIDLGTLTGFAPLDTALKQSRDLLFYVAFSVLVAALMPKVRLAHPRAIAQYFAYAIATGLLLQTVARVVGIGLFSMFANDSLNAALGLSSAAVLLFGYLPTIWLGAVTPIRTFPRVIPVSRTRIVIAVIGGFAIMGAMNVLLSQLMFRLGIVLI
jgi:hypothetical protein